MVFKGKQNNSLQKIIILTEWLLCVSFLNTVHILAHLILTTTLRRQVHHHHLHLRDEETLNSWLLNGV